MKHFTSIKRWSLMVCALFLGFTASAQCTWTLNGDDSFGDGWNGGSVEIFDNGTPVAGSPFIVTGSTDSWTFTVTSGNTLQLDWNAGGFLGEVSFELLDDSGTAVFTQASPAPATTPSLHTQTITCTPCVTLPVGLVADNFTQTGEADLNWDAVFGANSYDIEWGLPGFTPGSGAALGSVTGEVTTTTTASGLTGNTTYEFYVQSDCGNGWSLAGSFFYISCEQPTAFNVIGSDLTSGSFDWTENAGATEWQFEYGAPGFTQGSGTFQGVMQNPDTINGLASNMFFEVYVQSICGVGDSSLWTGPLVFNTYNQGLYMEADNECPDTGFVDISQTGVLNTLGDDGEVTTTVPFPFLYQGGLVTDITIGSNGGVIMTGGAQVGFGNGAMATAADGLYPFWDDLGPEEAGEGVFFQTIGTAPNQIFVIQWNKDHLGGNGDTYIFQAQIHETTGEIYFVYDVVDVNDPTNDYGNSATVGAAGPNQDVQVSFNSPTYLQNESCVNFYYTNCPKPVNLAITGITTEGADISWGAGLSNETEWVVEYGLPGFAPGTGTANTVNANATQITGLDDITDYEVYIYALCANGDTSFALTGTFQTLPNCADPTGLALASAVDSVFATWAFTPNTGFDIQEYGFEYGPTGFQNGMGTTIFGVDTVSLSDTIVDASLMAGGIYDVYIQAICLTNDSSNWVGPVSVTMPLTNDSTCLAQAIPVDAVNYSFNGTGATAQLGELGIAPPAGPCDGQMTWCNSSITASTWFTFVAPASGNIRIDGEFQDFDGQLAVYEATDCADFNTYTLLGANDNFNLNGDDFPYLNVCGLTPGNTYYMLHDPNGGAGIYSLRLQEVAVEAGSDNGLLNVCLGDTVNLNTQLTGADAGGTWTESIPTAGFNDPIWPSTGLASQVYTFEYTVLDGCATDTVQTTVEIYDASNAGIDGTINACQNEPVTLWNGLVGSIGLDVTGTWTDFDGVTQLPNADITAESIPGQYNYSYVAGNGVCPDDSSVVTVIVDPTCDYLNLQEVTFESMDLYPNPTTNVFYISNEGATEVYNYELTDLNGKVITAKENAINGVETTEVSVENLETGVYLIRIFNDNAEKTYRVVKQ